MKYKVYRHADAKKLRGAIPRRYHTQVKWSEYKQAEAVLLLFDHDREDVIISSSVRHALETIKDVSEKTRVAVGGCFTTDAIELLNEAGFIIYRLSDFVWTDESYKSITKATV